MKFPRLFPLSFLVLTSFSTLAADDPATACQQAAKLYQQQDIKAAMEEAQWCVTLLQQLMAKQTQQVFPDKIGGYTGQDIEQNSAMGMNITERRYQNKQGEISVKLTSGDNGAMASALSAMAQFGMSPGKAIRVQRYKGTDLSEDDFTQLQFALKNGAVLSFESSDVPRDEVLSFAESFPLAEIEQAL